MIEFKPDKPHTFNHQTYQTPPPPTIHPAAQQSLTNSLPGITSGTSVGDVLENEQRFIANECNWNVYSIQSGKIGCTLRRTDECDVWDDFRRTSNVQSTSRSLPFDNNSPQHPCTSRFGSISMCGPGSIANGHHTLNGPLPHYYSQEFHISSFDSRLVDGAHFSCSPNP